MKNIPRLKSATEEEPSSKTFLVITEKGQHVAEKIAQILEILEE